MIDEVHYILGHFPLRLGVVCREVVAVDDGHFVCVDTEAGALVLKAVQDDEKVTAANAENAAPEEEAPRTEGSQNDATNGDA